MMVAHTITSDEETWLTIVPAQMMSKSKAEVEWLLSFILNGVVRHFYHCAVKVNTEESSRY